MVHHKLCLRKAFGVSRFETFIITPCRIYDKLGGGGGGVSESTDRRRCAILTLKVVPKNLVFA